MAKTTETHGVFVPVNIHNPYLGRTSWADEGTWSIRGE